MKIMNRKRVLAGAVVVFAVLGAGGAIMNQRHNGLNALSQEFMAADTRTVIDSACPDWMNSKRYGLKCLGTADTFRTMLAVDSRLGEAFTERWEENPPRSGIYSSKINYHRKRYRAVVMEPQPGLHVGYVVLGPDKP